MASTLLWYDLETFGIHPRWDRIAQFAAVRTNNRFEPLGDPISITCRVSEDYLPEPDSCLVTGLTPRRVREGAVREVELAGLVYREMTVAGTCTAGYNVIRFDDEFVRNLFYRNFYDPYVREYENGNSRWDIIDLARMTHDLRPEGIEWVHDTDGRPSFRLEELARANRIAHDRAHDALADVHATIALAKLLHDRQPKLFNYYFRLRNRNEARKLLNLSSPQPVVHTSRMFSRPGGCSTVVFPLSVSATNSNEIIAYDLRFDPREWIDLPVEEIRRRVFSPGEELAPEQRVHLKGIHLNRAPAIAPLTTLSSERARSLGLDVERCEEHARLLRARSDLVQKVREVYAPPARTSPPPRDPELQIYTGGFFGDEDRETFERIHRTEPKELVASPPRFVDPRGPELLRRYLARNYPELLPADEKRRWLSYCASRLLAPELDEVLDYGRFRRKVEHLIARTDTSPADKVVLRELLDYGNWIEENVLRYRAS